MVILMHRQPLISILGDTTQAMYRIDAVTSTLEQEYMHRVLKVSLDHRRNDLFSLLSYSGRRTTC